jgi:S1-C subfamily serine protease
MQNELSMQESKGVIVIDIDPKESTLSGQVQKMDIIREVDRKAVNSAEEYLAALSAKKKGQTVLLLVVRGSKPLFVAVDVP